MLSLQEDKLRSLFITKKPCFTIRQGFFNIKKMDIQKILKVIELNNAKKKNFRVDSRAINIKMLTGETVMQKDLNLPKGICIRGVAYINGNDPAEPVNISIRDTSGNIVVQSTHYKDWIKGTGKYFDSMKHMYFDSGRQVTVHLSSSTPLTADLEIQVVLTIKVK